MTSNYQTCLLTSFDPDGAERFTDACQQAAQHNLVERIWQRDHTVWQPAPTEIDNRLGWLDLPEDTASQLVSLQGRVQGLIQQGFTDVVLLGMGGSSLCPEVFRRVFPPKSGCPNLHVLDSTFPDWVRKTAAAVNLEQTLVIVASKSGGTVEVLSAFKYFWNLFSQQTDKPGQHFIAITDPGTSLAGLGQEKEFAEVFENRPDVGGRFSALSFFGMIPALLIGINVEKMLDLAVQMATDCQQADPELNPGLKLALAMAAAHACGRDKLTLLTNPRLNSLGLWIEQLVAESTGKQDKGILPIAEEPVLDPAVYGNDRLFVAIVMQGDSSLDAQLEALRQQGHPVIVMTIEDTLQLGAVFFAWEFATALFSHFLAINPFDQPNVQAAKTLGGQLIKTYQATGEVPVVSETRGFGDLLDAIEPGRFLAIMAYLLETPDTQAALARLRSAVMTRYHIATTSGYGPRFLHSTGQYHKGGPNLGVFLQLVQSGVVDLPIPGDKTTFSVLCQAQAAGDYQALVENGRLVVQIDVGSDPVEAIDRLTAMVGSH